MSIVICKIPKAGLGNQLYPLMKAYTFAHLNNLPVIVYNYHQLKPGPWLRNEKTKRNYNGFFKFQKSFLGEQWVRWSLRKYRNFVKLTEPAIERLPGATDNNTAYIFSEIPHYSDRFRGLMENKAIVLKLFNDLLSASIAETVSGSEFPCIGVHIRMGDFKAMNTGEAFGTKGAVRTPERYFIDVINKLREINGSVLPVSVFTDGSEKELEELFSMDNVDIVEGNNDLVDMLLLSKSKIIVTSASSTFSYWAAFLSDATIIMHPSFTAFKTREDQRRDQKFEGPADESNFQFMTEIRQIPQFNMFT